MSFRLIVDHSSEDEVTPPKLRYMVYSTYEEALAQAEHELATPAAKEAYSERHRNELFPSGVRPLRIIDEKTGEVAWKL